MKCLSTRQYIRADGVDGYQIWNGQCPGAARRPGVHDTICPPSRRLVQLLHEYNAVYSISN